MLNSFVPRFRASRGKCAYNLPECLGRSSLKPSELCSDVAGGNTGEHIPTGEAIVHSATCIVMIFHSHPREGYIEEERKEPKSHSPTKHTEVFFINYFGKMRVFPHGSVIKIEKFGISHFHLKDGQGRLFIT